MPSVPICIFQDVRALMGARQLLRHTSIRPPHVHPVTRAEVVVVPVGETRLGGLLDLYAVPVANLASIRPLEVLRPPVLLGSLAVSPFPFSVCVVVLIGGVQIVPKCSFQVRVTFEVNRPVTTCRPRGHVSQEQKEHGFFSTIKFF